MTARVLAGVGGFVLIAFACVVTGGFALASIAAMAIAAIVCEARSRPYTRALGWGSALFGAVLAFAALVAYVARDAPRDTLTRIRQQATAATPPPRSSDAVQRTIERAYPGATAISQAQSEAIGRAMGGSPGVFWTVMAISLLAVAGFFGTFVGTVAWGSATVFFYGVLGHWPSTSGRARGMTSNLAHDSLDEI